MSASAPPKSKEEIAAAYRSPPWWYDARGLFILTFAYRSTLWRQIGLFAGNVGSRHLEVAIGSGSLFDLVRKWRNWRRLPEGQVVGIDYAESMLAGAIARFSHQPGIELRLADAASLPYDPDSFDTANIANAVHCFPDVDGAIREVFRVLKPGGTLAANVLLHPGGPRPLRWIAMRINDWGIRKGILYSPYHVAEIDAKLKDAGFSIESAAVSGNTYNVVARKPLTSASS